jgi:hypothetical protein
LDFFDFRGLPLTGTLRFTRPTTETERICNYSVVSSRLRSSHTGVGWFFGAIPTRDEAKPHNLKKSKLV